jgi:RNA polymerase sigma factor (sigma-70 family)
MTRDEELDAILATLGGDLDDAELDRRTARFCGALRRLREDPAEATRIDTLLTDAGDDTIVAALVTGAAAGDPDAWYAIVERYSPLVWSICTRFRLSRADSEDVGQNVWLLLVDHLSDLRKPAALPGWLATTTRRECLRVVAAARKPERPGTKLDEERQVARDLAIQEAILIAERNAVLRAAFAELPHQWQQLLSMLISDPSYSYAEISATLHIPIGSIGPLRARCLGRLRRSSALIAQAQENQALRPGTRGQAHDSPDDQ